MKLAKVCKILFLGLTFVVIVFIEHMIFRGWNSTEKNTGEQFGAVTDDVGLPFTNHGPVPDCIIRKKPGVVMLTTANLAFVDFVLNMLASVRKVGVCVDTTVIAEDGMAYDELQKYTKGDPAVNVLRTSSGEMDAMESRRGNAQYFGIMNKRQAYILSLLERGLEVLFTDSDTFWFRDPFPYFEGNYDMFIRGSRPHNQTRRINEIEFCAGFIYLKPTIATVQFVRTWVKVMEDYKKWGLLYPDQTVMNNLLKDDKPVHMNIKMLDPDLFPWGAAFFNPSWQKQNHPTVVMHAASIRGHPLKLQKFKELDMWLVNVKDFAGDSDSYEEPLLLALSCAFFLLFVIILLSIRRAGS
ncbi:UDP-D-xylose:L-fucose alpha-1,3-D-xylosyltransferase-like isoform X2 [Patiria miniata]|uniref:Nucleotide-diphospho-sugar transferase domain-containing protein n=1 Tax=Patiria miniata TaxID=46514 RepID=A0A914B7H3_PATMI|nr:UDP-D-xylose:L-fucose alpha-1,3-D-xylosyltransferase-like isoform X2 [Patiria miniata]